MKTMWRRWLSCMLCALLVMSMFSFNVSAAERFEDVPENAWYLKAVETVCDAKIFSGSDSTHFEPDKVMTRAQFVSVLSRFSTNYDATRFKSSSFKDVPEGQWFTAPVGWASLTGIVSGVSSTSFAPDRSVTREQMVSILYRFVKKANDAAGVSTETAPLSVLSDFSDNKKVSSYAREAMAWAVENKLINGANGKLLPQGKTKRCEAAQFFSKALQVVRNRAVPLPAQVPVLMYHNLTTDESQVGENTITEAQFRREMELIRESGRTPVSVRQLIDYVENGASLPEKAVCITFDDGYLSNYEIAYPILRQFNYKATIFMIGSSVGDDHYKDTEHQITPHFDYVQAKEMYRSGLISLQSHTYDMHQKASWEVGNKKIRQNILPLKNETEEEYRAALTEDFYNSYNETESATGGIVYALAYPGGKYCTLTQNILESMGVKITFSIDPGVAVFKRGDASTLRYVKRLYVLPSTSEEQFKDWLS